MEPEADAEGGRVDVPPDAEGPHRRPWGRITAVLVVALVTITALAIAVRQPNRPPSISDVSVSSDTATVATPPAPLTFMAQATDPDGDALTYSWNFGDGQTGSDTQPTHVYAVPGWYTAVLTVSDGKGGVATNDDRLLFIHVRSDLSDGAVPSNPPSPSSCPVVCVSSTGLAVLVANRSAAAAGSEVRFSGNASWAYVWAWSNASNASLGGTYTVVSAAENASLFSFGYSWGDGTTNTTGTAIEVGQTAHRFSSPGNYFVRLSVSSGALTTSAGYTVRVLAGAPPAQLKYPDIFASTTAREPDSLEPAIDNESAGGGVLQNVYETLVTFPSDSESVDPLVPRLATEVPSMANNGTSADGKNYTFQLRQDVVFHDLTPMTARDVSASFRRLLAIHAPVGPSLILDRLMTNLISTFADTDCNPSIPGRQDCTIGDWVNKTFPVRAAVPSYISAALPPEPSWDTTALNVSTAWAVSNSTTMPTGNYSVVFHLLRPYPALLALLASTFGSILSESCVGRHGGVRWGVSNAFLARGSECGSGPFTLATWSSNQAILLARFDQYWRGAAKAASIQILPVRDALSREFMLLAGDVDSAAIGRDHQWDVMNPDGTPRSPTLRIAKDRPAFDMSFFGYNQKINVTTAPDAITVPITFFADAHVRRAFTYAFDYGGFLANVTHDAGLQPRGPVPLGLPGYNASIPLFPFDLAQAVVELNATPYWVSGFNLTLYYRAGNGYEEQGGRLIARGLEALHSQKGSPGAIRVDVRSLDAAAYDASLRSGGLPLALFSWAATFADPLDSVMPFLRTGSPFATWIGYGNATLDSLIDAATSELNGTTRVQDFLDLSARAVLDDVPYLWVFQATSFHVERAWVTGYYFNPMLWGLDYYRLSKA